MSGDALPFFKIGGTLASDAACYVERQADRDLLEALRAGEFCYVLDTRQFGKSSLMSRTAARLREEGALVAIIDLNALGDCTEAEQWYFGMLDHLGEQLDRQQVQAAGPLEAYWEERKSLAPMHRLMNALRDVVLRTTPRRLVIMVDEIDYVRKLSNFGTDEFFAGIRECYNRRARDPDFERLTFCLLGVATPSDLIKDTRVTPFNIGRRIELRDFTAAEAAGLRPGFASDDATAARLLERVLHWTGGHPYLTQRLACAVAEDRAASRPEDVDRHCRALFLETTAREKDDNLLFVRDRLLRGSSDLVGLLELLTKIWKGRQVPNDETNSLVSDLRLAGVVRPIDGRLEIRNRIYREVFDLEWIDRAMPGVERRRQRRAFVRGIAFAAGTALLVAGLYYYLAVREYVRYFDDYELRHAIPEGFTPLTLAQVRQRDFSMKFVHRGRLGRLLRIEGVNARSGVSTSSTISRVINPATKPTGPRRECVWEFQYEKGELRGYLARNAYQDVVFELAFDRTPVGQKTVRGRYRRGPSMAPQARSGASQVRFVLREDGYVMGVHFEDGYDNPLPDDNRAYGYRYERDRRGRELSRTVLGADEKPAWHKDGWVTAKPFIDPQDRPVGFAYFDDKGSAVDTADGYSYYKTTLDGAGRSVRTEYWNAKNERTYNDEAYHAVTMKRDAEGRITERRYLKAQEKDELTVMRGSESGVYAGSNTTYDANGYPASVSYFGTDGKECTNYEGVTGYRYVNDAKGNRCCQSALGPGGRPAYDRNSTSHLLMEFDDRGLLVNTYCLDAEYRPAFTGNGVYRVAIRYDDWGREIEKRLYGTDGKVTSHKDGYAIVRWSYLDALNYFNWTTTEYFDEEDRPTAGPENAPKVTQIFKGVATIKTGNKAAGKAGKAGREIDLSQEMASYELTYLRDPTVPGPERPQAPAGKEARGADAPETTRRPASAGKDTAAGALANQRNNETESGSDGVKSGDSADGVEIFSASVGALATAGFAKRIYRYGRTPQVPVVEEYFSTDGKGGFPPVALSSGEHRRVYRLDERGRQNWMERYGLDRGFVGETPINRAQFGRYNKITLVRFCGPNGEPGPNKGGVAGREFEYDYAGRTTRTTSVGVDGQPRDKDGMASYHQEYDERGDLIAERWTNAAGEPAAGPDGYARVEYKNDGAGRDIERRVYGPDGKVTMVLHHVRDERGRIVGWEYFQADGKTRAVTKNKVSIYKFELDACGRFVTERCFDEKGAPTRHAEGYTIKRNGYDARGRVVDEAFFKGEQEPIDARKAGEEMEAHRITRSYDDQGRLREKRLYRAEAKPGEFLCKLERSDERGRTVEEQYLDAEEKLALGPGKYARAKTEYDPQGQWERYTYYDTKGQPSSALAGFREVLFSRLPPGSRAAGEPAEATVQRRYLGADGTKGYVTRLDYLDAERNVIEQRYLDAADKLVNNTEDGYALARSSYDAKKRPLSYRLFDATGRPARYRNNAYSLEYAYDLPDGGSRRTFRGFDGSEGYVNRIDHYDAKGRIYRREYLDAKDQPARAARGCSEEQIEYVGEAEIHRYTGYDPAWGYVRAEEHYAADGLQLSEAYFDAAGQPVQTWVVVAKCVPGGEAERIGLQPGDVILSYAGRELHEFRQFRALTLERGGQQREVQISRGGKTLTLQAKPGPLSVYGVNKVVPLPERGPGN